MSSVTYGAYFLYKVKGENYSSLKIEGLNVEIFLKSSGEKIVLQFISTILLTELLSLFSFDLKFCPDPAFLVGIH